MVASARRPEPCPEVSAGVPVAVAPARAAVAAVPASAAVRPARSAVPAVRPRRGRKSKRAKRAEYENMQAPVVGGVRLPHGNGETIRLARGASLSDFAEKIDANPAALVQALFNLGEMVTATQSVGDETLELLGSEMNYVVQVVSPEDEDRELLESFDLTYGEDEGGEDDLQTRPPVVTVMGHVDHGKTRLLDTIRKANVREGEAGGITQHIGAYQVSVDFDGTERPITFIDTPGHEAFTAMRARGAKATDIAILVVAADDGVMPQTVEAINHAQAADVPIVVAVNKIDKEGADPAKIRGQLTEYGLVAEDFGGDTMFVDISAKQGTNIEALEEAVLLTADAALDLRANPDMEAQGVAIEAHLDRGRGPVATVLIQRGTLRVGDSVVAGDAYGRVRRMVDEHGEDVHEALPSRPVQVIGFTSVPGAGDNLLVVDEDRIARQIADRRSARKRNALAARSRKRISLDDLDAALKETSQLNLILKGDNAGTVEALEEALLGIQVDDEVELRVIDRGVGGITETNVNLASASDAVIIGFNVRAEGKATELANREGVEIRYYSVIYQAIDEIEKALRGMLKPIYEENQLGSCRDPGAVPVLEGRCHRRLHDHLRGGASQREGPPAAGQHRGLREPHDHLAAPGEGRRDRGPRGLRVRYDAGLLRHQGRRRHRVLRAGPKGAHLMVDQARARRLEKRIATIVASAIEREIKDPGLAGVTIVDAKVTADLHDATVYYTVMGPTLNDEPDFAGAAAALDRAKGTLRTKVGAGTGVRFTPTLAFSRDTTSDSVARMDELLARARAADADVARVRAGAKPAGEADPYRDRGAEAASPSGGLDGLEDAGDDYRPEN